MILAGGSFAFADTLGLAASATLRDLATTNRTVYKLLLSIDSGDVLGTAAAFSADCLTLPANLDLATNEGRLVKSR
jgi:hypothetical protein